ncbi:protein CASPARIAN STRIP INTEGRITY FACTOR 1-like [Nicotiana tabacum]|uniref:Protein CASPARIAN STRIP INTEGRITY FACTOR 1-like n=1 Tax=Nicotiana tabacum TaxID=4097 RepID=A0A1S3Z0Z9_TOBAC|nr:PREDICTED: uncharacterized protein LOC107781807 [Nicotiana tabacum]
MGGIMLIKKIGFFFLLISASLLSPSFAGRRSRSLSNFEQEKLGAIHEEQQLRHDDEVSKIHERLLKVNTKDYGRYDPTPALSKPPFKLIPN